jgi:hypothetical protein
MGGAAEEVRVFPPRPPSAVVKGGRGGKTLREGAMDASGV